MLIIMFSTVHMVVTPTPLANQVTVANVGDSQAFLMRNGQAVSLTTPHKVYGSGAHQHLGGVLGSLVNVRQSRVAALL